MLSCSDYGQLLITGTTVLVVRKYHLLRSTWETYASLYLVEKDAEKVKSSYRYMTHARIHRFIMPVVC